MHCNVTAIKKVHVSLGTNGPVEEYRNRPTLIGTFYDTGHMPCEVEMLLSINVAGSNVYLHVEKQP